MYNRFTSRRARLMGFSNTYGGQYWMCIVTSRVFNTSMGLIQNVPVILHKNNCKTSINTFWTDYPSNAQLLSLCPWDQWASRARCLCSSVISSHLNARSVCPSQRGRTACGWGSAEELTFFPHPVFTRVFRLACLVFRGCAVVFLAPMPNSPNCAKSNWAKNQMFDKQSGAKFSVYVTLI